MNFSLKKEKVVPPYSRIRLILQILTAYPASF